MHGFQKMGENDRKWSSIRSISPPLLDSEYFGLRCFKIRLTATLRSVSDREFILSNSSPTLLVSGVFHKQNQNPSLKQFSTTIKPERSENSSLLP
ncbi:hypothetical protein L1049_027310 [Liquidambar formosana]|uniref:Uncharacterized protein n=1 Tax=Liquidambar formosana TaxID=63359 RepID=A0AAP0N779_LIQFO